MGSYSILTTAPASIERVLRDLHLRPADRDYTPAVAVKERARFYMTPVVDRRGHQVWFKATLRKGDWLRHSLREEIRVQRGFADYEKRYHPRFDSPSFIASHDNRHGFVWLLRKYWEGIFAGDMTEWFGLSPVFYRHVSPAVMANILADVRAMTPFMGRRMSLDQHSAGWYLLDFHYYRRHFFAPLLKSSFNPGWRHDDIDRMEELIHAQRAFLRRHATTFSHGDFYPNNIMIRPKSSRPVVLFDWELSHLNLPTFDATMLYLHAWRRPIWQAEFRRLTFRHLGQSKVMHDAWRLSMLSLATRLAGFAFIRLTNGQPDRYPRLPKSQRPTMEKLFRHHLKHLRAAYENTEPKA